MRARYFGQGPDAACTVWTLNSSGGGTLAAPVAGVGDAAAVVLLPEVPPGGGRLTRRLIRTCDPPFEAPCDGDVDKLRLMKVGLFVLLATVLEAAGDAIIRVALSHPSGAARAGLFALGTVLLGLYGTSLNLAPVEFAAVTGAYIATLFVVFQITNYLFFGATPTPAVLLGGTLIVAGGLVVALWR